MQLTPASEARRLLPIVGVGAAGLTALAIILLPPPFNLLVVPTLAFGLLLVLAPALSPIFLTLTVPVQEVGARAGLSATKIAIASTLMLALIFVLGRTRAGSRSILFLPYAIYLAVMVISLMNAQVIGPGLVAIYQWMVPLFALWLGLVALGNRRTVLALLAVMGVGVFAEVALGLVQSLLGLGPASFAIAPNLSRAFGTFGRPNTFAAYLELTGPILIAAAVWSLGQTRSRLSEYRAIRHRGMAAGQDARRALTRSACLSFWLALTGLMSLVGIGTSFSRGAWLGTSAALLAMLMLAGRRAPLVGGSLLVLVGLALGAGGIDYAPAAIRDRYEQLVDQLRFFDSNEVLITNENFAAVERMAHWQTGIAMFKAHPLLGVGIGNFNDRFSEFAVNPAFPKSEGHAHNYYIQAAAETGALGLTAYLTLTASALLLCLRTARRAGTSYGRALGIGATGVTVALIVHNVVEDLHVLNLGVQLSMVWALALIGFRSSPDQDVASLASFGKK